MDRPFGIYKLFDPCFHSHPYRASHFNRIKPIIVAEPVDTGDRIQVVNPAVGPISPGELSAKARDGKLGPAEMQGGSFTISSLGGIGGTAFTPIINAPEVAILGVSKAQTKPVWDGKAFAPRLMIPLSLSYDHRVIDGADAVRFTTFLARALADVPGLLRAIP